MFIKISLPKKIWKMFFLIFLTMLANDWQKYLFFLNYKYVRAEWISKQESALKEACKISW